MKSVDSAKGLTRWCVSQMLGGLWSVDDLKAMLRMDSTPLGLHASVRSPNSGIDGRMTYIFQQTTGAVLVDTVRAKIKAVPIVGHRHTGFVVDRTRALMKTHSIIHTYFDGVTKVSRVLLPKTPNALNRFVCRIASNVQEGACAPSTESRRE